MNACQVLVKRLAPYRDPPSKGGKGLCWKDACAAAFGDHVQLSADGWFAPPVAVPGLDFSFKYFVYAAAVAVVELDVLTGQTQILRTDIVYDCGQSFNSVDVGQIEGGFVMGIGTWLTEEANSTKGWVYTERHVEYKPPCSKDIPLSLNCIPRNNPNVEGILGSKATAEPPMILTNSVYFALRKCIAEARMANGMAASDARTFVLGAQPPQRGCYYRSHNRDPVMNFTKSCVEEKKKEKGDIAFQRPDSSARARDDAARAYSWHSPVACPSSLILGHWC